MLFTNLHFIVLLIITWSLYYISSIKNLQILILIVASFIFYAWNFPLLLTLLLCSITINILVSHLLKITINKNRRKTYAIIGVVINLGILAFFKYSPLIGSTFFQQWADVGEFLISIPLPIGISFFTFQGVSLVVDTFKEKDLNDYLLSEKYKLKDHVPNIALFIAFFPQLIAGPIVKAHEFLPQIRPKFIKDINFELCFKNIVLGYFLKMVVADNLKDQTYWISYPYFENFSVVELFVLLFGFAIQIFADFAGYSLIAIGISGLFGYKLRKNFNFPYISTSFKELWKRWHISLSTFLMEYLYIPLGGSRKGNKRTYLNLMATMTLGGLWHGAAWSYAIWGIYHGAALAIERFIKINININHKIPNFLKGAIVFLSTALGFLFFKLPDINHFIKYIQCFFTNDLFNFKADSLLKVFFVLAYSLPVIIYHIMYLFKENYTFNLNNLYRFEPVFYGILLFLILSNRGSTIDFIYFQF